MTSKFKNYHGSKEERVRKELRWFSKTLTSLLAIPLPSQTHNNYFNSISVLYLLYLNSFINLTMMIFYGQYLTKSAYNFLFYLGWSNTYILVPAWVASDSKVIIYTMVRKGVMLFCNARAKRKQMKSVIFLFWL